MHHYTDHVIKSKEHMKISIAMATYNGAEYIQEQLQSFIDQTRQPDELIITDDCSTDETEAIVREFAKTAPFKVEFYKNEKNLGYCGNFNAALMKTTGDLVFLSDQDDVFFPEKFQHMLKLAERSPEALVLMNDAALTDGDLKEVGLTKIGQIKSAGFTLDSFVMGCCCVVRRDFLDFCLPIPQAFKAHDNWIVEIARALNAKVVDDQVLQFYRRHESNESQFIANRTTRVTKSQAFIHTLKGLFKKDADERTRQSLEQQRVFADGIENAKVKAPSKYHQDLNTLVKSTLERVEAAEKRMNVRDKIFYKRFFAVLGLLKNGGYKNTSGTKAVIRDLLGI